MFIYIYIFIYIFILDVQASNSTCPITYIDETFGQDCRTDVCKRLDKFAGLQMLWGCFFGARSFPLSLLPAVFSPPVFS